MAGDPTQFNLCDYFLSAERLHQIGNRTAIEFRDRRITYNELNREVELWASELLGRGVVPFDRVALLLYDSPSLIACFLAAVSVGAVCVPINTFLPANDIEFIVSDSGSRLLIVESELEEKVTSSAGADGSRTILKVDTRTRSTNEVANDGSNRHTKAPTFAIHPPSCFTPRAAPGSRRVFFIIMARYRSRSKAMGQRHCVLQVKIESSHRHGLFFAYGLGNSLSFPLAAGATVILDAERINAERLASVVTEKAPTVFFGVPAVYLSLLDYRLGGGQIDFSGVRLCVSAGEALPAQIFEDWQREFGRAILDGIGSTEMLHIFISNSRREGARGIEWYGG